MSPTPENRAGAFRRQSTGYTAFVPAPFPPTDLRLDGLQELLEKATLALGRLVGSTEILPDPDLFAIHDVRREAVLSSQIEGTTGMRVRQMSARVVRGARWGVVMIAAVMVGCGSTRAEPLVVRPGAPGEASRTLPPTAVPVPVRPTFTEADVAFVQGMIMHHAQALVLTALVPEHSSSGTLGGLAERMETSQKDEITWLRTWLARRGQPATEGGMPDHAMHTRMPGMLSPQQLDQLRAARGPAFDRLFIELMIQHHEGALVMVGELFATGGGQEPELYQFASHVDADQRAEIARMRRVLETLERDQPWT